MPERHEWQSKAAAFDYRQMAADLEEDMKIIQKSLLKAKARERPGGVGIERRADIQSLQAQYLELKIKRDNFLRRAEAREKGKKNGEENY